MTLFSAAVLADFRAEHVPDACAAIASTIVALSIARDVTGRSRQLNTLPYAAPRSLIPSARPGNLAAFPSWPLPERVVTEDDVELEAVLTTPCRSGLTLAITSPGAQLECIAT